jgi:hypothetical protein
MRKYIDIPCPQLGYNTLSRKAFASGDCIIIVTRDVYPDGAVRWHLSISCANRYPTWDEIHDAPYALLPDAVTMGILLPPKREYVNLSLNPPR